MKKIEATTANTERNQICREITGMDKKKSNPKRETTGENDTIIPE